MRVVEKGYGMFGERDWESEASFSASISNSQFPVPILSPAVEAHLLAQFPGQEGFGISREISI